MKKILLYLYLTCLALSTAASTNNEPRACNTDDKFTHYNLNIGGSDKCILKESFKRVPKLVSAVNVDNGVTIDSDSTYVMVNFNSIDPNNCSGQYGECFPYSLFDLEIYNTKDLSTPLQKGVINSVSSSTVKISKADVRAGPGTNCDEVVASSQYSCSFKAFYQYANVPGASIVEKTVSFIVNIPGNSILGNTEIVIKETPQLRSINGPLMESFTGIENAGTLERWDSAGFDGNQITVGSSDGDKSVSVKEDIHLQLYASDAGNQTVDFSTSGYKVFLVNGTTEIDITGDVVGTPINYDDSGNGRKTFRLSIKAQYLGVYDIKVQAAHVNSRRRLKGIEVEQGSFSQATIPISVVPSQDFSQVSVLMIAILGIGIAVSLFLYSQNQKLKQKRNETICRV